MPPFKGVTPIIATVILLLITVALAGAAFTYLTSYSSILTSSAIEVTSINCQDRVANIYLKNIGTGPISLPSSVQSQEYAPDANTRLLWHLNEVAPDTCPILPPQVGPLNDTCDSSGNNLHGQWASSPLPISGKFSLALDFDGTSSFINIASNNLLNPPDALTLEAWVYVSAVNALDLPVISKMPQLGGSGYRLSVDGTSSPPNQLLIKLVVDNIPASQYSTSSVPTGDWAHIAFTYDTRSDKGRFYINGADAGSFTIAGNSITHNSGFLRIAQSPNPVPGPTYADINLDEIRLSNAARVFTPFMCTVSGGTATCGGIEVTKQAGTGPFDPGFDKPTLNPGQVAVMKDPCTGSSCTYKLIAAGRVLTAVAYC